MINAGACAKPIAFFGGFGVRIVSSPAFWVEVETAKHVGIFRIVLGRQKFR